MSAPETSDDGFSLVEVIIASFLLAMIACAILPALVTGIQYTAQQSAVATATRELNSLVERARLDPRCSTLATLAASRPFSDGANRPLTSSGSVTTCASKNAAKLTLSATDSSGTTLATVSALVYIP